MFRFRLLLGCFITPKCLILTFGVLILLILVVSFLFHFTILCSAWQVSSAVNILCSLYENGEIAGNLCDDLCSRNTLIIGPCQTHHMAKEIVFEAEWHKKKIVIKSDHVNFKSYDSVSLKTSLTQVQYPSIPTFKEMIANHMKLNLNVSIDPTEDITSKLWYLDLKKLNLTQVHAAMDSLWSLLQQNEYVLMKYFEEKKVFPQVIGTCGHFYAVEYISPIITADWINNVVNAGKILELSDKLETNFHEPLHLCDIKYNHFGIDSENNIKVLDVDTAYFKSVIDKIILSEKRCEEDGDCSFWDCHSKCDSWNKRCTQGVANTNLQVICKKIFLGHSSHSLLLKPFEKGLLKPMLYNDNLKKVLQDCAGVTKTSSNVSNFHLKMLLRKEFHRLLQKLTKA